MRFLHCRFKSFAQKIWCIGLCITLLGASGFCGVAGAASLYDAINLTGEYEGKTPPVDFTFDEDVTLGQGEAGALPTDATSLGILKRANPDTARSFAINGNGRRLSNGTDSEGNGYSGVTVQKGDKLTISNLTVEGFGNSWSFDSGPFVTVEKDGTVDFSGQNTIEGSVENNGTLNVAGATTFASGYGVSGEGTISITDTGSLTVQTGFSQDFLSDKVINDGTLTFLSPESGSSGGGQNVSISASPNNRGVLNIKLADGEPIGGTIRDQDIYVLTGGALVVGPPSSDGVSVLDATDNVTVDDGKIDIANNNYFSPTVRKVVQLNNFEAKGKNSQIVFNTELSRDASGKGVAVCDSIEITGKASGTVNLALSASSSGISLIGRNNGNIINNGFKIGDSATISLFRGGDLGDLRLVGQTITALSGISYKFSALTDEEIKESADRGKLHVEALEGYSLYDAINLTGMAKTIVPNEYVFDEDVTLGASSGAGVLPAGEKSLGVLARKADGSSRDLVIGGNNHELNGNGNGGIIVRNGDSLNISYLTVSGFNGAFVTNNGTLTLRSVDMRNSIVNNGSLVVPMAGLLGTYASASNGVSGLVFASGYGVSGTGNIDISMYTSLTIDANKLGNNVVNNGTLKLTNGGTLSREVISENAMSWYTRKLELQAATVIAAAVKNQHIVLNDVSYGYSTVPDPANISAKGNTLQFGGMSYGEGEDARGALDLQNGKASVLYVDTKLVNDGYLKLDVDLAAKEMDRFEGSATVAEEGKQLHITSLALLTDATNDVTKVLFAPKDSELVTKAAVRYDGAPHIASFTQEYAVAYDKNGNFTFTKTGASESTKSISDTVSTVNMAWVANINNLQKRLGDLRGGEESNTGWVRFQRNNDDLNNGRNLNVSGNLYQIGYDFALKNDASSRGYFGLSLERFDGTQSFKIGGGDIESTTLSAYYTKIYESGHYFDFIFRYGRYDSDTTSYDTTPMIPVCTKLDYAMNGVTLSGEYGYRWNLGKGGLYFEPQAEFIYGYLSGAKKTSSTGFLADIDSTNHFITRWGAALGQRVKNFNYYLRASYFHDFAGATSVKYGTASYKQDSAQNWWEVSVGGGWNISKTSYFYAELTKHFKDVSNSLNFNLGFRLTL